MKNYYEILEVRDFASEEVVKAAYKALVKRYHPDNNPYSEADVDGKMEEINEAYSILSDSETKRKFDAELRDKNRMGNSYAYRANNQSSKADQPKTETNSHAQAGNNTQAHNTTKETNNTKADSSTKTPYINKWAGMLWTIGTAVFVVIGSLVWGMYINPYSSSNKVEPAVSNSSYTDLVDYARTEKSLEEERIEKEKEEYLAFEELTFSRTGIDNVKGINLPNGDYYFVLIYNGDSNFCAKLYEDLVTPYGDLIANMIGPGACVYGFSGSMKNGYVQVAMASGDWELQIIPCHLYRYDYSGLPYSISGYGTSCVWAVNLPMDWDYYITMNYRGNSNFVVYFSQTVSGYPRLIANTIGTSSTVYGLSGGIKNGYFNIESSGEWEITIERVD